MQATELPSGGGADQKKPTAEQQQEARNSMMAQLLDNAARERLNRISIVKQDKATAVEQLIIRMAQTGQLKGRVTEPELIQLLEQIPSQSEKTTVKFSRRNYSDDEDEWDL